MINFGGIIILAFPNAQWRGKGGRNVGFRRCAVTLPALYVDAVTLPRAGATLRRCVDAATLR